MKTSPNLNIFYPLKSLGNIDVSLSEIRIESIRTRIVPRVPFPHKHDFFHILVIESGSGWHEIDFIRHKVKDRQIFVVKPGQVHGWKLEKSIKGYVIEFKREALDKNIPIVSDLINQILAARDEFILKSSEFENLNLICDEMQCEFKEEKDLYDISLQALITGLLVHIVRHIGQGNPDKFIPQSITDRFVALVNFYYKKEHSVNYYARRLSLSSKTLKSHIQRTYKKSPRQIIQERFLLEAKRLLSYSHLTVAEIAYEVGFEDPNYFSRFFRKHEKMTPGEFQKKIKGDNFKKTAKQ